MVDFLLKCRPMSKKSLLPILTFGVLWALLLRLLSVHWSLNPQYSFGWLVPFLGVFLLVQAWRERPPPSAPLHPKAALGVSALAGGAIFPTWLLEQPNPDWRLIVWALGIEVILISLGAIYCAGGKAWLTHFAFPIGFILTAIPWPTGLELILIQNLMRAVAAGTVEILALLGIPALQHGNVIEIGAGMLGIDEACSGVRSLQSSFMAAVFLGELYRCSFPRRIALAGIGIGLALICNFGRATFLAWEAARHGMEAIAKFHDPAGFTILTICFILVWVAAFLIAPAASPRRLRQEGAAYPLPRLFLPALAIWIFATLGMTEIWFRLHEGGPHEQLAFSWPTSRKGFRELEIPELPAIYLKFDQGRAARWEESDGGIWQASYFKWKEGPARSRILARSHRPEICFPGGGFKLQEDLGRQRFDLGDKAVFFHVYSFQRNNHTAYIFFCTWEDGHPSDSRTNWSRWTGIGSALRGERNLGQEVIEFVLLNYASVQEAMESFQARLPGLLTVNLGSGSLEMVSTRAEKRGP